MAKKNQKRAKPRLGRERPPNLRQASQGEQRACASCEHFKGAYCQRWQWPVKAFHVCDTWAQKMDEPSPEQERRNLANEVVAGSGKNIIVHVDAGGGGA